MALANFETVAAAAEALQAAGQRASVRSVRTAIGGGSFNTVLQLLSDWKAGRPLIKASQTELDPKISAVIGEQMQLVAAAAAKAAEERAASAEDDLQTLSEAQTLAEQQIADLTAARDSAEAQIKELGEKLTENAAAAGRAIDQGRVIAQDLRSDLSAERTKQETTAAALVRAEMRLEVVPGLHAEIERLKSVLDASQAARQTAEQAAAVLAAKLDAAERRATEADARTAKAEAAVTQATAKAEATARELVSANAAVQAGQARLESAAREIEDAKKAASAASAAAKKSGEEAAELRGQLATSNKNQA